MLVTVVPMLAPMIIGTAASTPNKPVPTRPTIVDVVTDDDCASTVASTPTHNPATGFVTLENSSSWMSLPRPLMPPSSSETPIRKR